jgi:menaquinone-dependent protoporphyrinogen oxidase
MDVDLQDASTASAPTGYDVVILGGAVYMRRWQHDARRFLRKHRAALTTARVWLFSSGPVDPETVVPNNDVIPMVSRFARKVNAEEHVTFGGRLQLDAGDWFARTLARRGMAGDFRDESAVRAWADRIATRLTPPPSTQIDNDDVPA